jgi:predicted nucleic acid-binding protein
MMIAGIAAAVGAVLATRNVKDFASATLQVVDPWIGKP